MKIKLFPLWIAFVLGIALLGLGTSNAFADTVYLKWGPLNFTVPWDNMNATYIWNFQAKQSQVGGEMVFMNTQIASIHSNPVNLNLTGGGEINANSQNVGSGFAGLNLNSPSWAIGQFQPGVAGGYQINGHFWWFGLKSAFPIFGS
jgi:hypothetical protein